MYIFENPVLQRELVVNLRMTRAFVLLFGYVALLGLVVFLAWPQERQLDLTTNPESSKRLVNLFFAGQYILASLMAPSFTAGAISGEKERDSYEMLMASPLRPGAIVIGKLFASLCHLAILIFASLPIVVLCIPLGGVSVYEVLAAYLVLALSVLTFGMISLACSSYFKRTASSLVVAYLAILPLSMLGAYLWKSLEAKSDLRIWAATTILPIATAIVCLFLFLVIRRRLSYCGDLGSSGREVADPDGEPAKSIGLVLQRERFPDWLFAPAKRATLLADGANPVYDKEMQAEIFSQGTLMLRVVIQVSMLLVIPLMAVCLYIYLDLAPLFIAYVLLFNVLVGPVFSAGAVTSERERQTLDMLLTTMLTPHQILWAKLLSGLRVSSVLTSLLLWPVALAVVLVPLGDLNVLRLDNALTVVAYLTVVAVACVTTATTALFCSVISRKTATSLMASYVLIVALYAAPLAVRFFAETFFQGTDAMAWASAASLLSPFAVVAQLPIQTSLGQSLGLHEGWRLFGGHLLFYITFNATLIVTMLRLFRTRWRVSG